MQKYCVEITEFETGIREVPDADGDYYRVADVDASIAELELALRGFVEFQICDYSRMSDAAKRYCELRRAARSLMVTES